MSFRRQQLNQKAVVWAQSGYDATGEPIVSSGSEVSCRWEDRQDEILGEDATPIAFDATVLLDQDVAVDSLMWLGELANVPDPVTDLHIVVKFNKVPDIKGRKFTRTAHLVKYRDSLPTVE